MKARERTHAREIAPRITADPSVRFGKAVIKGTRVDVATVVGQLAAGATVDEVMREYGIKREDVLAALAYAASILARERVQALS